MKIMICNLRTLFVSPTLSEPMNSIINDRRSIKWPAMRLYRLLVAPELVNPLKTILI